MRHFMICLALAVVNNIFLYGQNGQPTAKQRAALHHLIDQYSQAREKRDTVLLRSILTTGIDQLVSTGEWRAGMETAINGMQRSSAETPGTRSLRIDKMRMLQATVAIVDCEYNIQNTDGSVRKMWSTFIVVVEKKKWKITAIRNMLPAQS